MGGAIGMGNTCKPMAVLFQCMTKFTTNKKKKERINPTLLHKKKKEREREKTFLARPTSLIQMYMPHVYIKKERR